MRVKFDVQAKLRPVSLALSGASTVHKLSRER